MLPAGKSKRKICPSNRTGARAPYIFREPATKKGRRVIVNESKTSRQNARNTPAIGRERGALQRSLINLKISQGDGSGAVGGGEGAVMLFNLRDRTAFAQFCWSVGQARALSSNFQA